MVAGIRRSTRVLATACRAVVRRAAPLADAPQHHAGEVLLLGGVPLAGDQHSEALTGVGDETCKG